MNLKQLNRKDIVMPDYDSCILNTITSILKHYNVKTTHSSNKKLDDILKKDYRNVVLIILDGMGDYVLKNLSSDGYFYKNKLDTVTSVYPSTTTAALTSYYSGKSPYETAWIAWSQYFKEYGRYLDMFKQTDSYTEESYKSKINVFESVINYETIFDQIEKAGFNAYELVPSYSIKRSKKSMRCDNLDELINGIDTLSKTNDKKFIFAYSDNPDNLLHKYGTESDYCKKFICTAEEKIAKMVANLEDTLVIISADHGHKNIEKVYTISDKSDLFDCLIMPPSLESRCVSFWVKEDKKDTFTNLFKKYFQDDFILLTKEEFLENKFLGAGVKHKKIDDFIGNYIALSISSSMIRIENYFFEGKQVKKSTHCGLTKEEMMVPVIVIEKD